MVFSWSIWDLSWLQTIPRKLGRYAATQDPRQTSRKPFHYLVKNSVVKLAFRWCKVTFSILFFLNFFFFIFFFQVRRYFPVANLTRTRQAVILEPLRPERFFVRTFNATSLYILSICEVCGSYQCPYCPHYSNSNLWELSSFLSVFITLLHYLT